MPTANFPQTMASPLDPTRLHTLIYRRLADRVLRPVVWGIVLSIIAGALVRTFLCQGLFPRVEVASGSMAPALVGPHHAVRCQECNLVFAVDGAGRLAGGTAICPNCGGETSVAPELAPGSSLVVDRLSLAWRPPERWDALVFRRHRQLVVKRLIGLPGEQVAIDGGDLWIDGAPLQKSLAEFRRVAAPVYDDRFRRVDANESASSHFHVPTPGHWREAEGSFFHEGAPDPHDALDYRYFNGSQPVGDLYAYNQAAPHPNFVVDDLLLAGRATWSADAKFGVRLRRRGAAIDVTLDSTGWLRVESKRQVFRQAVEFPRDTFAFEIGCVDGRVLLGVNGEQVAATALDEPLAQPALASRDKSEIPPLRVTASGSLKLSELRVLRDLLYLTPRGLPGRWTAPRLGRNEYFVLGDNVPRSTDSRAGWRVDARRIVGRARLRRW